MKIRLIDVNNLQSPGFRIDRKKGLPIRLFVLFKSKAEILVDGAFVKTGSGDCILYDKYAPQHYYPIENESLLHDFIEFDTESEQETALLQTIPQNRIIRLLLPEVLSNLLCQIRTEYYIENAIHKQEILTALATVFLYKLQEESQKIYFDSKKRSHYGDLYSIRTDFYNNPSKDWSIDAICKKMCLSKSYFQALYKSFFAISYGEDLIKAKINRAKLLLLSTNMTVGEISEACGYANCEHFIRQFKRLEGHPPSRFRHEVRDPSYD